MAASSITTTPPSPTPPTNFSFLGSTPPTAPAQPTADDGVAGVLTAFAPKTASVDNANFPSIEHEGRGTEVVWTATSANPGPYGQLQAVSDLGNYTSTPNASHASSLSPLTNPTLTNITPGNSVSGVGTTTLGAVGTGFTKQSVIYVNGVPQTTTFVSATSITAANVTKKTTAGSWPVVVITGGAVTTTPVSWTFT